MKNWARWSSCCTNTASTGSRPVRLVELSESASLGDRTCAPDFCHVTRSEEGLYGERPLFLGIDLPAEPHVIHLLVRAIVGGEVLLHAYAGVVLESSELRVVRAPVLFLPLPEALPYRAGVVENCWVERLGRQLSSYRSALCTLSMSARL